jgi:hypothetical protein
MVKGRVLALEVDNNLKFVGEVSEVTVLLKNARGN